jgi:uncharacterized protein (TIGR02466 family)
MITPITLFRSDIFIESNVGSLDQRADIISQIKQKQIKFSKGMKNSNEGCYRISTPCTDINWLLNKIDVILNHAIEFYADQDSMFKRNLPVNINYWANINSVGSRNNMHSHKSESFSAVYYLQATGTGELRFPNPANLLGDCSRTSPFIRDFFLDPKDGDLVLWPSWMMHEVESNLSSKERINLAFDIKFNT